MDVKIEESWKEQLKDEFDKDYFVKKTYFLRTEYRTKPIYPPAK
jgi:uracil-DNA glycosylase